MCVYDIDIYDVLCAYMSIYGRKYFILTDVQKNHFNV